MRSMSLRAVAVGAAMALASSAAAPAHAAMVAWTIDSAQSFVNVSFQDQTIPVPTQFGTLNVDFRARNQVGSSNGWTQGNRSALSGTINTQTNFLSSIEFLGGTHSIDGLTSGNWDPLAAPPGGTGTAPADFGVKVQARHALATLNQWTDTAFAAIRDVAYDVDSGGAIAIAGGAFAATNVDLGLLAGHAEFRGVGTLGGQLDPGTTDLPLTAVSNGAGGNATLAISGALATLTLPISVPLALDVGDGIVLSLNMAGQIVATAAIPTLPGDANMDLMVDIFDVAVISNHWGQAGPTGDVNHDMTVDIFDVAVVSNNWGATLDGVPAANAVPEPHAIGLALLSLAVAAGFGGRLVSRRQRSA